MTKKIIPFFAMAAIGFVACKDEAKQEVTADTVVKTDTVVAVVTQEVDTNAIIAFYKEQHTAKGTANTGTKAKGTKKVSVDSDPIFVSLDVIEKPTPAPAASGSSAEPAKTDTIVKIVHDVQMYYFIPDEKASFPGGEKAFDKYLLDNLEYPEKALEAGVSRTVYPTLYLDEQGKPEKVEFRYEPTIYGFQDEARRILMNSPRWNPAKVGGKPVKSKFTIPISFKLQ